MGAKSVRTVVSKKTNCKEMAGVDYHLIGDKCKEPVDLGVSVVRTEWVRECLVSLPSSTVNTFECAAETGSVQLLGRCLPIDCLKDKG
jgi:hypothetical protein